MKAIHALEKTGAEMPEIRITKTVILKDIPPSLARDIGGTHLNGRKVTIPVEHYRSAITTSGESIGEYDFFFEWLEAPTIENMNELIDKIDETLAPLGCYYTVTTKK